MNLTNNSAEGFCVENSASFSKYFPDEEKGGDCSYSESSLSQTLLLETTLVYSKPQADLKKKIFLFNEQKMDDVHVSRQKSLMLDLCEEFQVSQSNLNNIKEQQGEQSHQKIQDLYNICRTLISTLEKLENKVVKMEEKDIRSKDIDKDSSSSLQKEAQSILTYSSLQANKNGKWDNQNHQKEIIDGLFEALQSRSKEQVSKSENQELKKQIIILQITNEDIRKALKRSEAQNGRLKELLRQYQNFNKKMIVERDFEGGNQLSRNHSQKVLRERQFHKSKSNIGFHQSMKKENKKIIPINSYHFKRSNEQEKQNIKGYDSRTQKLRFQQYEKKVKSPIQPMRKTIDHTSTSYKHRRMVTDMQQIESKGSQLDQKIPFQLLTSKFNPSRHSGCQKFVKITSFQQCKQIQPSSDYTSDYIDSSEIPFSSTIYTSKPAPNRSSKTFRDLKQNKVSQSKRINY